MARECTVGVIFAAPTFSAEVVIVDTIEKKKPFNVFNVWMSVITTALELLNGAINMCSMLVLILLQPEAFFICTIFPIIYNLIYVLF